MAVTVHGDEDHLRFGNLDALTPSSVISGSIPPPALGFDLYTNRDRRATDAHRGREEAHDIAGEHRLVEIDLPHRLGHVEVWRNPERFDARGEIDVREDHSTEDRTVRVGVLRQHHDLDGGQTLAHPVSICAHAVTLQEIYVRATISTIRLSEKRLSWAQM